MWATLCGAFAILVLATGCPPPPVACDSNTDCDNGTFCDGAETCVDGACANGDDPCTGDTPFCDEDANECVECNSDDDCDPADECTDAVCNDDGTCGTETGCDAPDACTDPSCVDGECSEESACDPATEVCLASGECAETCTEPADCDDSNDCTIDTCTSDVCLHTAVDCDDDDPCTTDTCVPASGCAHADKCPAGQACDPDTGDCLDQECTEDADCDDDDPCTTDTCNEDDVCENEENTGACDDDDLCTTNDTCADGECAGTQVQCAQGQTCNPANGNCEEIVCSSNADCDDGFSCTDDTCSAGTCVYTAINARCNDGLFCTGTGNPDLCDPFNEDANAAGCVLVPHTCVNPAPVCDEATDACVACTTDAQCADTFSCTTNTCAAGSCAIQFVHTSCADSLFCTGTDATDVCDPESDDAGPDGCVRRSPCDCSVDPNSCIPAGAGQPNTGNQLCNEATDACEKCTGNSQCNDNVSCTADVCDGASGTCSHATGVPGNCPDNLFCTGADAADVCDPDANDAGPDGCVRAGNPCACPAAAAGPGCAGLDVDQTGNKLCTEATDTCANCTGNTQCSDGIACTNDTCNGQNGLCVHDPDNTKCPAGQVCDAVEGCVVP